MFSAVAASGAIREQCDISRYDGRLRRFREAAQFFQHFGDAGEVRELRVLWYSSSDILLVYLVLDRLRLFPRPR